MMKLVQEAECPHCKKKIEMETDVDNLTIDQKKVKTNSTVQVEDKPEVEVKEVIKEVIKTQTPSYIPSFKCKDGNCGLTHKNPNYTKQIKGKCANCGQFSANLDSECPFCNQKEYEEISKEDLTDLGIPEPKEKEETHDHTE